MSGISGRRPRLTRALRFDSSIRTRRLSAKCCARAHTPLKCRRQWVSQRLHPKRLLLFLRQHTPQQTLLVATLLASLALVAIWLCRRCLFLRFFLLLHFGWYLATGRLRPWVRETSSSHRFPGIIARLCRLAALFRSTIQARRAIAEGPRPRRRAGEVEAFSAACPDSDWRVAGPSAQAAPTSSAIFLRADAVDLFWFVCNNSVLRVGQLSLKNFPI